MAVFSHHSVASTCTGSHVVGWNITISGNPKAQIEGRLKLVDDLINSGFKRDFKMVMATITQSQIDHSNGVIPELMKEIGWNEVFVGPVHPPTREKNTGAIHLYAIGPKEYEEGLTAYKTKLRAQLKELKKGPISAAELAERQKFPELLIINLKKQGLIIPECKVLDTPILKALVAGRSIETLTAHLRMRYGVDYNDAFDGKFKDQTLRSMKEYHAGWRSGKII